MELDPTSAPAKRGAGLARELVTARMEHRHAGPAPFFSDAVARVMEDAMVDQEVILGVLIHLTSLAYAAISVGAAGILLGSVEDPLSDDVRAQVENTFLAKLLESLGDGP